MLVPGTNHCYLSNHVLAVCLERATVTSDQSHILLRSITTLITLLIALWIVFPCYPLFARLLFPYYTVILHSILRSRIVPVLLGDRVPVLYCYIT